MRIMMLSQFYPPTIGGEEQHVRGLSAALAARGHDVSVVTLAQEGLPRRARDGRVTVYRVSGTAQRFDGLYSDPSRRFAPPLPDPELALALRRVMLRERPEVIHAHNWIAHSFLPLKATTDARLVVTLHDYGLVCATKRLMQGESPCSGPELKRCLACAGRHYGAAKGSAVVLGVRLMKRAQAAAVDMFMPVSRAVAEGTGLDNSGLPYRVMPNFVSDDLADQADGTSPLLDLLPRDGFLMFAGDLSRDKGLSVLLRAYERLVSAPPLVLVGRRCPETPGRFPRNVIHLGAWPREAVIAAWQRSLFAVVPSIWPDPCPSVAIEALCCGRPVIASAMGGLNDIVSEGCGVLVPPGDAVALEQAMSCLLDDEELRVRMGKAALHQAAGFKAGSVVPRIEEIYEGLVRARLQRSSA